MTRITLANKEVKFLLDSVAPERQVELDKLWKKYEPEFRLLEDDGPAGQFVMEAGLYRIVRFNHRVMRLFWLGAFVAWEGYVSLHAHLVGEQGASFARFREMIDNFNRVLAEGDPATIPLPAHVPVPGSFPSRDDPMRGPAELAVFCAGWALLHEIRHIQFQQEGKSAASDDRDAMRAEEFSCDEYATKFILEQVGEYAKLHSVSEQQVHFKRSVGIYFALFTMALASRDRWGQTDTHPAFQDRIVAIRRHMGPDDINLADAIAHAAFGALWHFWPNAPGPFKRVR